MDAERITDEQETLPYICPDHPAAQVRREWNRTRTHIRLTGATNEFDWGHQYFCNECGRELAAEERKGVTGRCVADLWKLNTGGSDGR